MDSRLLELRKLHKSITKCTKCTLHKKRINVVSGTGHFDPRIVFVAEAPGNEEDKTGLPFQGDSGLIVYRWIDELRLLDTDFAILNIVKCHPPNNRDPLDEEIDTCTKLWLEKQLKILNPEIIVSIGRIASAYFLGGVYRVGILTYAGRFYKDSKSRSIFPIVHPSYFLRRGSKQKEWEPYLAPLKIYLNMGC